MIQDICDQKWKSISDRQLAEPPFQITPNVAAFSLSVMSLCNLMDGSILGFPVLQHLPEFAQTHVHWVNDTIQPSHSFPLLLHQGLSNESALHIKYWNFNFSINPSREYSGLISFRLLAVQRTLKSLLQHHNLKASILWHSAFFMAQLSHPYMTAGKTIALTTQTFIGKVIYLLFNILSRFIIAFSGRMVNFLRHWIP